MDRIQYIVKEDLERVENKLYSIIDNNNNVLTELNSFLKSPSKRIRSVLGILYVKGQNITLSEETINILAAGELIHNASLMHDDVIDDSKTRRGKITQAEKFSPKISILLGDLLISKAIKIIFDLNLPEIADCFLACMDEMCNAEIEQFLGRNKHIELNQYTDICKGKTASLFKAILTSIAKLNNLDAQKAEYFAEIFGLLFQIKNDLEPVSAKEDLKNGICTIKDIVGIEKTNYLIDNYKEEMKGIIRDFPKNEYTRGLEDLIDIL